MPFEKLKYGGYVNFPLAPKDIKGVQKLVDQYTTPDDLMSLLRGFCADFWGVRIEGNESQDGWKVVVYNLLPLKEGGDKAYYVSGESNTLLKALCVVRYKVDGIPRSDYHLWVTDKPRGEFR